VRLGQVTVALILFALAVAPLGAVWWLINTDDPLNQAANVVTPVYGRALPETLSGATEAVVSLQWGKGKQILAPNWEGTVTDVLVKPGDVLKSGQAVLAINGVTRIAFASVRPFWRSLVPQDSGADVAMLNQVLSELGLSATNGNTWTAATTQGVKDLQTQYLQVAATSTVESFDPAWIIWLPKEKLRLGSIAATVGSPAPAAGEVVLTGRQRLVRTTIQDLEGQPLALNNEQPWVFETTEFGNRLNIEEGQLSDASVAELRQQAQPGSESLSGTLRYKTPRQVASVPTTAVLNQGSQTCIWVASDTQSTSHLTALPVTVVSGSATATFLEPLANPDAKILVNPAAVAELPPCS
jgi:hypothetical protein